MSTATQVPPKPTVKYESYVEEQLARARNRIRLLDLTVALLGFLIGTFAFGLVVVLLDRIFQLPSLARQAFFVVYALGAAAYIGWTVVRPLMRKVNPYYAAQQVEHSVQGAKNSVVNWLDLRDQGLPEAIRGMVSHRAARDLAQADIDSAISARHASILGGIFGGLFIAMLVLFVISGPQFFSLLERAFAPFGDTSIATRTHLTMIKPVDGNITVSVGTKVEIEVLAEGRVPEAHQPDALKVLFRHQLSDPYIEKPMDRGTDKEWKTQLAAGEVQTGFWYKVTGGDAATLEYRVQVRSNPLVEVAEVKYHFRPYLNRPDETARDPHLEALRGTEVTLTAHANRHVTEGKLEFIGENKSVPAEKIPDDPQALRFKFVIDHDATYRIWFTSVEREKNNEPMQYKIHALPDNPPKVELIKPGSEVELPANGLLQLEGVARDDFGIDKMALKIFTGDREQAKPYRDGKSFKFDNGNYPLKLEYKDFVDLAEVKLQNGQALQPGMEIEYWLEAIDNCDFPQPNIGKSERFKVKIVDPEKDKPKQQQEREEAKNEKEQHNKQQDQKLAEENQKQNEQQSKEENPQQPENKNEDQKLKDQANKINQAIKDEEKDSKPDQAKGDQAKGDQAKGDQAKGDQPKGDQAKGDQAKGDQAKGDQAKGDQAKGDQAKGDQAKGDQAKGDQAKGDQAKGDQAKGDQAKGDQAKGDQAKGDQSKGDQTKGDQAKGDQAKGDQSKGDQAKGDQAKGDQAKGDQSKGDQAKGDQPKGDQAKGDQAKGDQAKGDQAKGDQPKGDRAKGDQPKGDQAKGDQAKGDQAKGDQAKGDQPKGDQAKGDQGKGDQPEGDQAKGDQPKGDQAKGDQAKGDQPKGDQAKGDQAKGDQAKGDQAKGDQPKGDQAKGDQAKGDQAKGDQAKGDQQKGEKPSQKQIDQLIKDLKSGDAKVREQASKKLEDMKDAIQDPALRKAAEEALEKQKQNQGQQGNKSPDQKQGDGPQKPGNQGEAKKDNQQPGNKDGKPDGGNPGKADQGNQGDKGDKGNAGQGNQDAKNDQGDGKQGQGKDGKPGQGQDGNKGEDGKGDPNGKGSNPGGGPGKGTQGERQGPAQNAEPDGPGTAPDPRFQKKAGELQLEDIKKKIKENPDILKKANMTEKEYLEWLKAYENMLKRNEPAAKNEEKLANPKDRSGSLTNVAPKKMNSNPNQNNRPQGASSSSAPPEFREHYKEFTEKLSGLEKVPQKK